MIVESGVHVPFQKVAGIAVSSAGSSVNFGPETQALQLVVLLHERTRNW